MTSLVEAVAGHVHASCVKTRCRKDRCSASMQGTPAKRVLIDLDCEALRISDLRRCDFLFVGETGALAWVVPIELKSGTYRASDVAEQLQGGANIAERWLPDDRSFRFVPVLVFGKAGHKKRRQNLRAVRITLRSQSRQPELIRSGKPLASVLQGE